MKEHFLLKYPITPDELKKLETHCFSILSNAVKGEVVERMNYLVDGCECVFLHSDSKRYVLTIKPIRENGEKV